MTLTTRLNSKQDHIVYAHGLMILHMMFFHFCVSTIYGSQLYYTILHPLSFFMAWFFFKSGMFYKEREIKDVLKTNFIKLIVPAIVFSALGFFCYLFFEQPGFRFSYELGFLYVFGSLRGNVPIWFLFSLFAVQMLFSIMRKCKINIYCIALLALGLYIFNKHIGLRPYWTYNIPLGLMFFTLGQVFKDIQYYRIPIIICIIVFCGLFFFHTDINFRDGVFSPAIVALPWTLAGCILTNVLFKSFPSICIAPLRFFGEHAMEFYCTHIIIIYMIEQFIKHYHFYISHIIFEFIAFAFYLILFAIIIHNFKLKHIQWMFGRSNHT